MCNEGGSVRADGRVWRGLDGLGSPLYILATHVHHTAIQQYIYIHDLIANNDLTTTCTKKE